MRSHRLVVASSMCDPLLHGRRTTRLGAGLGRHRSSRLAVGNSIARSSRAIQLGGTRRCSSVGRVVSRIHLPRQAAQLGVAWRNTLELGAQRRRLAEIAQS
jgi:hypothetical protein